jgi:hypothetical protein
MAHEGTAKNWSYHRPIKSLLIGLKLGTEAHKGIMLQFRSGAQNFDHMTTSFDQIQNP